MLFHRVHANRFFVIAVAITPIQLRLASSPHLVLFCGGLIISWCERCTGHRHVLLALTPVLPTWTCFVLSVLEGQLAKRSLGGDLTAALVTGYGDLHTSSWWIITAVTTHTTCWAGPSSPDDPPVVVRSHHGLVSLFQMRLRTVTSEAGSTAHLKEIYLGRKTREGSRLTNVATGSLPPWEELSWQHKNMHTYTGKEKTDAHNRAWYFIHIYIYIYILPLTNGSHSCSELFASLRALYFVCVGYPFPWDGTCSIKSRKKPFSGMTHRHTHTHTHAHAAQGGLEDLNCT